MAKSKLTPQAAFTFILRHGAAIQAAVDLEAAITAKPRNSAAIRKAGLALIAAEAPNVNTGSPRLRAAIDEMAAALAEESVR